MGDKDDAKPTSPAGLEERSSGTTQNNDDDDNPKTTLAMEKTTNDYNNDTFLEVHTTEDKNPSINLL